MRTVVWRDLDAGGRHAALARPARRGDPELLAAVRQIVERVRDGGWDALAAEAVRIDGCPPRREPVAPAAHEARRRLRPEQIDAVELAARHVSLFHQRTRPADHYVETAPGLTVGKVWRAVERVGLYVPGGAAPLFSTLLMLALPARQAGVEELVVVTPPRVGGGLDPAVAIAAELCGVEAIWTVGGAQAIAALAFGAGDIPPVDKICGPGNAWVAEAKRLVASDPGGPSVDLPAGPSELMVIADGGASAVSVAADLLSQAEHDASAQVLLVTNSSTLAADVARELELQVEALPRPEIARTALASATIVLTASTSDALDVANAYAPEHLTLAVADASTLVERVRNAGSVFVGGDAAEAFGDYLAGPSHVLPTDGAARAWSGVSVHTFLKAMSVQSLTPDAAARLAAPAALLARLEGLEAHARAAEARAGVR